MNIFEDKDATITVAEFQASPMQPVGSVQSVRKPHTAPIPGEEVIEGTRNSFQLFFYDLNRTDSVSLAS